MSITWQKIQITWSMRVHALLYSLLCLESMMKVLFGDALKFAWESRYVGKVLFLWLTTIELGTTGISCSNSRCFLDHIYKPKAKCIRFSTPMCNKNEN